MTAASYALGSTVGIVRKSPRVYVLKQHRMFARWFFFVDTQRSLRSEIKSVMTWIQSLHCIRTLS